MTTLAHNKPRVKRVKKLIKAGNYEDGKWAVRDILADLRHYCDSEGIDFADEDRVAYDSYSHELQFTD